MLVFLTVTAIVTVFPPFASFIVIFVVPAAFGAKVNVSPLSVGVTYELVAPELILKAPLLFPVIVTF